MPEFNSGAIDKVRIQDGGCRIQSGEMNIQKMPAYNAGEIDEEETRQRRWRAQDIEGGEGKKDNPMEGERDKAAFPIRQDWRIQKREMPNGGKGEGIRRNGK